MKNMAWFIVKKAGRVVDAVKAKDISLAMQEALDRWEKAAEKSNHLLEVLPMPNPVVVRATPSEIKEYAPIASGAGAVQDVNVQLQVNPVFAHYFKAK